MKKTALKLTILILLFFLMTCSCAFAPPEPHARDGILEICFDSPCFENTLLTQIEAATKRIDFALYGFDNESIARALLKAKRRGVQIRAVSEYDAEEQKSWQFLLRNGFNVIFGNNGGIMHNKYFIFDGNRILTGSTNLTAGMQSHFNNMILMRSTKLAEVYQHDFNRMYHAKLFAAAKDDSGFCPDQMGNAFLSGNFKITPYFTPYKNCYEILNGGPILLDNPETPEIDPENYTGALGYAVLPLLEKAEQSITVLAYSLTDKMMVNSLKKAYLERGVQVRVWMEESQFSSSYSHSANRIFELAKAVREVKLTKKPVGLLHHKVILIDDSTLILGSMNFSQNGASQNDENFLVLQNAGSIIQLFKKEIALMDPFSYYLKPEEEYTP
jgi:phosphatidylserine/phosphatidylglycerophosphate/cardiolipin synthase-like enzyme